MPQFAEVIYNPIAAYVAPLLIDSTYDTPVQVDYMQKLSFEFDADQDEIMVAGMIVEKLAVPKQATGEITQASLDFAGAVVLLGMSATGDQGVTPNRYNTLDIELGGDGLPYFGLIVAYASTLGGNLLAGFPKAILDTVPGFDVDQNKFRIGSAKWSGIAPSTTIRKAARLRRYETAAAIPTTSGNFLAFFNGMFD